MFTNSIGSSPAVKLRILACLGLILTALLLLVRPGSTRAAQWLDPSLDPQVRVVLNSADNQFSFWSGPSGQEEWLLNYGSASRTRIKSWQDVTALQFDLEGFRGSRVEDAELHLAKADEIPVFALAAATISQDWEEGSGSGGAARAGEPCWRWRRMPRSGTPPGPENEWTFSQSDFGTASFGNYGTLVSYGYRSSGTFGTYSSGGVTWLRMKLDSELIYALMLDQHGLAVTDARGRNGNYNPRIYTREQSSTLQPRLFIRFSDAPDGNGPGAARELRVASGPKSGHVVLQFKGPAQGADSEPFGYSVRYSTRQNFTEAASVANWRIPRTRGTEAISRVLIEDLEPGLTYYFFVQPYDRYGKLGPVSQVDFTVPNPLPNPEFLSGNFEISDPAGVTIPSIEARLRYWACSEIAKVNPVTGNEFSDGYAGSGSDDYRKANAVWDGAAKRVRLEAARNEVVGFQLILERLVPSLTNVQVVPSDLVGPDGSLIPASTHVELFQLHYVAGGVSRYADAAIPLAPPFPGAFSIPDSQHNPAGVNQSVWADLYVPFQAAPGLYLGELEITADQFSGSAKVEIELRVSPVTIPDDVSFFVDLNGYGNPWDFGPDRRLTALRYFQLGHKHRMVPNTLPYGWSGSVQADRKPSLAGFPSRAADWSTFDQKYGWFFDGSAFRPDLSESPYIGPGIGTPVATFYTPFFESWPVRVDDPSYGFDYLGQGGRYWDQRLDVDPDDAWANMPDIWGAFSPSYEDSVAGVVRDWFEHAQSLGWHKTRFQSYLNHKWNYEGCAALWTLEECSVADDFRAVGYFHDLFRAGQAEAEAPDVLWHFRIDISTRWSQQFGQLDERLNLFMINLESADWHWPNIFYRSYQLSNPEEWYWYGGGHGPSESSLGSAKLFLKGWSQGLEGTVPYWNSFSTNWTQAEVLSVIYSGQNVPGFGLYPGAVASVRMKTMRQAQQVIELLNLLARQPGWNRARVTRALLDRYGDGTWRRSFEALDEVQLYSLRADLLAQLEAILQPGGGEEHLLPQVADASQLRTSFLLYSMVDEPRQVAIDVRDAAGASVTLDLLEDGQEVGSTPLELNLDPAASRFLVTNGAHNENGAARVSVNGTGTGVSAVFTVLDSEGRFLTEAGIGPSRPATEFWIPVDTANGSNTGLALFNPGGAEAPVGGRGGLPGGPGLPDGFLVARSAVSRQPEADGAAVELTLFSEHGTELRREGFDLASGAHLARFVTGEGEFFPGIGEMRGSLRVSSSDPLAAIVLRQNLSKLNLTTLPVVGAGIQAQEVYFPHFADGPFPGGFITMSFQFFGLDNGAAQLTVHFSDREGQPIPVTIGGTTSASFALDLGERQVVFWETDGTGGSTGKLVSGAVRVAMDRPVGVAAIFTLRNEDGSFQTETGIGASVVRPESTIAVDNREGVSTGLALFNPGDQPVELRFLLYGPGGESMGEVLRTLGPNGQLALFVENELFPGVHLEQGSLGVLGPASALTLRQRTQPLTFTTMSVGDHAVGSGNQ